MILNRTRKIILWLPAAILVAASIVVTLILVTNNTDRIAKLEKAQDTSTITFTFNQGAQRFRIICKEDAGSADLYICATIRLSNGPTPTPTPTSGG